MKTLYNYLSETYLELSYQVSHDEASWLSQGIPHFDICFSHLYTKKGDLLHWLWTGDLFFPQYNTAIASFAVNIEEIPPIFKRQVEGDWKEPISE